MKMLICAECGDELDGPFAGYAGPDGEKICEFCYEESLIECCVCGEFFQEWDSGRIGDLLSVTEQTNRIAPGIYRIISHPYNWSNYLSGGLYTDALTLIGDLTEEIYISGGYPVGLICPACTTQINQSAALTSSPATHEE